MTIRIGYRVPHCTQLGPGNRFVIWVQGCHRRCEGCISPELQSFDHGVQIDISVLADEIAATPDIDGITISGGEPFAQAEELYELIKMVKAKKSPLNVVVFTGNTLEEIEKGSGFEKKLLGSIDVLIDGEYIKALDDNVANRGSANQRIIFLNPDLGEGFCNYYNNKIRRGAFVCIDNHLKLVGIPSKEMKQLINKFKDEGKANE